MLTSFHPISFKDIGKHSFNKFQEHSRIEKHFELFKSSDLDLQAAACYAIAKKESFLNKTWIKQDDYLEQFSSLKTKQENYIFTGEVVN